MFTVKYRESPAQGGTEFLFSAKVVHVVRDGNHFEDGIYLDPDWQDGPTPSDPRMRFAQTVILFGGDQTAAAEARRGGKVWIMNEAGNTVASYDL